MKKSLLALAVLGAFAGAASAQTNVTIYGVVDAGVRNSKSFDFENWTKTDSTWALGSQQSGSRIGFKGTEDLGGGLSAVFALENGFAPDTGALAVNNTLFNRQAWVGLNGGFGTVTLGRQYTPMHIAVDSIDPFATGLSGDTENVFAAGSLLTSALFSSTTPGGFGTDNTVNNSVKYATPNFGGFSATAIYGFGEQTGSTSLEQQYGLSAEYRNGPIAAVVAYHRANGGPATATAIGTATADAAFGAAFGDGAKGTTMYAGATYDFGVVKAHGAIAEDEVKLVGGAVELKDRNYMLGVSAPIGGAASVFASWNRKDDRTVGGTFQMDQLAVGAAYKLSKRTNLYTSYGHTKAELAGEADLKKNDFRAGIRHLF